MLGAHKPIWEARPFAPFSLGGSLHPIALTNGFAGSVTTAWAVSPSNRLLSGSELADHSGDSES
jgi:hypothetical protein